MSHVQEPTDQAAEPARGPLIRDSSSTPELLPRIRQIINDDAVVTGITIPIFGERLDVTGSAKRHPKDDPYDEIGIQLSTARAFERAAVEIHAQAQARVERIDFQRRVDASIDLIRNALAKKRPMIWEER